MSDERMTAKEAAEALHRATQNWGVSLAEILGSRHPRVRMAERPWADYGDEDRAASTMADVVAHARRATLRFDGPMSVERVGHGWGLDEVVLKTRQPASVVFGEASEPEGGVLFPDEFFDPWLLELLDRVNHPRRPRSIVRTVLGRTNHMQNQETRKEEIAGAVEKARAEASTMPTGTSLIVADESGPVSGSPDSFSVGHFLLSDMRETTERIKGVSISPDDVASEGEAKESPAFEYEDDERRTLSAGWLVDDTLEVYVGDDVLSAASVSIPRDQALAFARWILRGADSDSPLMDAVDDVRGE